ncbi:MAG: o-succinylbenzoate synthase [Planctomycetota bacterium]|jgi:O-succinylbenzoate synthase
MAVPVERIELRIVTLPLVHPFQTSFGVETERMTVIVAVSSGKRTGFGESPVARIPGYAYETAETAFHILRDVFAPRVIGLEMEKAGDLSHHFKGLKGHPMARAGLEGALRDLLARHEDQSLATRIGGESGEIEVGVSIGIQASIEALLRRIEAFLSEGYRRVKIKIQPGWDVEVARAVRHAFPDLRLWADANQAYRREDLDRLRSLDEVGLELLEQPLHEDDLAGHATWVKAMQTPICLDEGVKNEVQLENALALGALGVLNIKPARVGGVSAAIRMEDRCRTAGIPVWCGGLLETGIGRLHNIAVASRPGFTLPGDISASNRYFKQDLIRPPVSLSAQGTLKVPEGIGLGHEVDEGFLDEATVRKAVVRV